MGPERERAIRYAQCGFADMSALKRFMLLQVDCVFCNFAITISKCVNLKLLKSIGKLW
jgi:hypothetical protein